jgi:hypothetical protein
MNFTLTPPHQYAHLKIWFRENWNALPETLDTPHADHRNLKKALDTAITSIDAHFSKGGKPNEVVNAYKRTLSNAYDALQDRSNWNLPLKIIENKNRI